MTVGGRNDDQGRKVLIGRHLEMKPWEIGGCGRSLRITEYQFKNLVGCTLSAGDYCTIVRNKLDSPIK